MATGPRDLFTLAGGFLDACVEALDTIPTFAPGLGGAPARSFVSPGQPAFDCCDQLTVHVAAVNELSPTAYGEKARIGHRTNMVTLVATSTRCIPVISDSGNIPSVTDMEAAAEQIDADGWALWNHVWNLIRADLLFTLCGQIYWDGLRSINPQGGCGGWVLQLRVELDGYEEIFGS